MQMFRQRKSLLGVAALVLVFAGCKGESPTAPSTSTTPPTTSTGGTTPPASGASVTVTVSNASPVVDSTSVVTATVTQNGAPVPNGTAVEFRTNLGTFTEGNAQTVIRTTTNGVATATLTASTVGTATVTATVGSTARSANVTFVARPVVTPPPDTSARITGISPALGRPQGGEVLTITGVNFVAPVRVLFDFGAAGTKEATVISVTPTQIQVLTPGVDLGAGQQLQATIVLINAAGSTSEQRLTSAANAFTFQSTVLTPKVTTVSPASGPIDGGTRVTIFGSGFQAPVQVFFGSAEAQVINTTFDQIVVVSPTARDTTPNAGTTLTGPVDIRIININSATTVTATGVFRYIPKMQITSFSPAFGSALGGTDVRIDGTGFNDPVAVDIAGVRAQVIRVSGTEILARTGALPSPCGTGVGGIIVTNIDNGDSATSTSGGGGAFSYVSVNPLITSVVGTSTPPIVPGGTAQVTVLNPGVGQLGTAIVTGTFGDKPIVLSPNQVSTGTGSHTFSFAIPLNLTFATQACTASGVPGTQQVAATFPLTFTNSTTGCSNTNPQALTVNPPNSSCVTQPVAQVAPAAVPCPGPSVASGSSANITLTVTNGTPTGGQSLNITSAVVAGANAADFSIVPSSAANIAPGSSVPFTVTFTPSATGARTANVTFATNDPARTSMTVNLCGTGTP
jgi:hypothetical protein